jgi:UDP-N-acetyl-D-glucosamine dehydrogenase
MPHYIATRVGELLNDHRKPVAGSRVLLLGVAYKRDIADVREPPAFALARRLRDRGAELRWHDPYVERFEVDGVPLPRVTELTAQELADTDVVVVHTDHSAYDWPAIVDDAPLLFDSRNATAGLTDLKIRRL